jgi:hypothetical protein
MFVIKKKLLKQLLFSRKILPFQIEKSKVDILKIITKWYFSIFPGGFRTVPDLTRAAVHFLRGFRAGALGPVNLDRDLLDD